MSSNKQLPEEVEFTLYEWFTSFFQLAHFWEQDDTYFIALWNEGKLYFVRVFQMGGKWVLSQDKVIEEAAEVASE